MQIKVWIQLRIPKIEDGNNFGVSIQVSNVAQCTTYSIVMCNVLWYLFFQEDILAEVSKAETDAAKFLEQISRYVRIINMLCTSTTRCLYDACKLFKVSPSLSAFLCFIWLLLATYIRVHWSYNYV